MKDEITKFLGNEEERRKAIEVENPYAILAEMLLTRSYTPQLVERVVTKLVENNDEDCLYLLSTIIKNPIEKAEILRKAGMTRRAMEILLNSLKSSEEEILRKSVKKIEEMDEENIPFLLSVARILKIKGMEQEARLIAEGVIFRLQGRGKYEESFKIQKKYKDLFG